MTGPEPQLLAIDLDGTLLERDGSVGSATRRAVDRLRRAGVIVVLASGRSPWAMRAVCEELALDGPQITMEGGLVVSPVTGERWDAWPLAADDVQAHLGLARDCGLEAALCFPDGWRMERVPAPDGPLPAPLRAEAARMRQVVSLQRWSGRGAIRTFLHIPPGRFDEVRTLAEHRFGARFARIWADDRGLELLAAGAGKGPALRAVARRLGIPLARVAAIGDGPNDLSMLAAAGISVAMGSAPAAVRAAATMVVAAGPGEGVCEALQRLYPETLARTEVESGDREALARPRKQRARDAGAAADGLSAGAAGSGPGDLDIALWFG